MNINDNKENLTSINRLKNTFLNKYKYNQIFDYEVLRQKGGDLALMLNAGILSKRPDALRIVKKDELHFLTFLANNENNILEPIAWINSPPIDVLNSASSIEGLLVVEVSTLGVYSARSLKLEN